MRWCAIVCLLGIAGAVNAAAEDVMLNQCNELRAQEHLDLNEGMGKWYVVEVIEHKVDPRQNNDGTQTTRVVIDACPIVKLRSIERRDGPPRLGLLWQEDAGSLEYTFWVSNNRGPGVWNSDVIQNGTLADKPSYRQFVGTVHVMKAVNSHMVLTFCARNNDGQKFSVILGREHKLSKTDMKGLHKLLERRNLQLLTIRESCLNGAGSASIVTTPIIASVCLAFLAILRKINC